MAVDGHAPDPPADLLATLQNQYPLTGPTEIVCRSQASDPTADHHDVSGCSVHHQMSPA